MTRENNAQLCICAPSSCILITTSTQYPVREVACYSPQTEAKRNHSLAGVEAMRASRVGTVGTLRNGCRTVGARKRRRSWSHVKVKDRHFSLVSKRGQATGVSLPLETESARALSSHHSTREWTQDGDTKCKRCGRILRGRIHSLNGTSRRHCIAKDNIANGHSRHTGLPDMENCSHFRVGLAWGQSGV